MAETSIDLTPAPRVTHPETKPATTLVAVESARDLRNFQRVPAYVYFGDPYHITPLRAAERALLKPGRAPFYAHGESRLFTAWHGWRHVVGRIAAFIDRDYDARTGKKSGFFGHFEFMNDARLPEALLAEAVLWLRSKGAQEIAGPLGFSPAYIPRGLLIDGFDDAPVIAAPYNPPSYLGFLVRLGLEKWFDEHGFELDTSVPPPEALAAKAKEVASREGLSVRPLDERRFDAEWETIRTLQNESHRSVPRFVPVPREDFDWSKRAVRAFLRILPGGALILEERGQPAGYALAIVDWNRVLRHLDGRLFPIGWLRAMILRRTIDRVRILGFGVLGEGRGRALPLVHALWERIHAAGYRRTHILPIAEDHPRALGLLEGLGARRTRTWRLLRVPASFPGPLTPCKA